MKTHPWFTPALVTVYSNGGHSERFLVTIQRLTEQGHSEGGRSNQLLTAVESTFGRLIKSLNPFRAFAAISI